MASLCRTAIVVTVRMCTHHGFFAFLFYSFRCCYYQRVVGVSVCSAVQVVVMLLVCVCVWANLISVYELQFTYNENYLPVALTHIHAQAKTRPDVYRLTIAHAYGLSA